MPLRTTDSLDSAAGKLKKGGLATSTPHTDILILFVVFRAGVDVTDDKPEDSEALVSGVTIIDALITIASSRFNRCVLFTF